MTTPQIPDRNQIVTPPINKTHLSCCGYQCHQGVPAPWQCPGCGKTHTDHLPPPST